MTFKKFSLLLFVGVLVLHNACEKDEKTSLSEANVSDCEYMTYQVGTEVKYNTANGIVTVEVVGTQDLNGETWLKIEMDKTSPSLIRCADEFLLASDTLGELIFRAVKIEGIAGDNWTDSYVINGVNSDYKRTMESVDGTRTIEGIEYTDVATVKVESFFDVDGFEVVLEPHNEYYSRSVGFLESTLVGGERTFLSRKN